MTKMKTYGKAGLMMTLLGSTIIGGAITTEAAEVKADYKSDAVINFIPNDEPTSPVDPEEPGGGGVTPIDPIDPTTPVEPGTPGPLSIDFASSLNFGIQKISSTDETYYAYSQQVTNEQGVTSNKPNYVQVTDNRGTAAGWTLSVTQLADFETTEAVKNKTLPGAAITLEGMSAVSATTATGNPIVKDTVTLVPGTAEVITAAAQDSGEGTWITRVGSTQTLFDDTETLNVDGTTTTVNKNKNIHLTVPGAIAKSAANYTAVLTWTLSDVVGN